MYNDPENFQEPFEGEEMEAPPSPIESGMDFVHAHGKKIIKILIVGIIAFLVYDYFIGSQVKVTIEGVDTEGRILENAEGKLFEGSNQNPIQIFSGSITLGLRPGEYRVEWEISSSGYKEPETLYFSVSAEDKGNELNEKSIFAKDLGVSIIAFNFPRTFVKGQSPATAKVTLKNNTPTEKTVELVFENGLKLFNETYTPSPITLAGNASQEITITIAVPETIKITNKRNGDQKQGVVRVKFTQEQEEISFTLFETFDFDVSPSNNVTFTAKADVLSEKTFRIRNPTQNDAGEGITPEITIKTASTNAISEIRNWFHWNITPPFPALKKTEDVSVNLQFRAPASAESDTITGEIKFKTSFWEKIVPFTVNLTEAVIQVIGSIDGTTSKTYTLTQDAMGNYNFKSAILKIENKSALEIPSVLYELDDASCQLYIQLLDDTFFPLQNIPAKGQVGAIKTTQVRITAPNTAIPSATKTCTIQLTFENPASGEATPMDPIIVTIQT